MAGEIAATYKTALVMYSNIRERCSGGLIWNGSAFEVYSSASGNQATYAGTMTEQGTASAYYVGNKPAAIGPGSYDITVKQRVNAWYAETDPVAAEGVGEWNVSGVAPLSDYATSGLVGQFLPIRIYRGSMVKNFPIYLKSSSDHITPFTSGQCSGQISRDGGPFGPLQSGAFSETGLGFYNLQAITSGDSLGTTLAMLFTAVNLSGGSADPLPMAMVTQRSSGSY